MSTLYPIVAALLGAALLTVLILLVHLVHCKVEIATLKAANEVYGRKLDEHHGGAFTCSEALTKARAATDIATRRAVRLKEQLVGQNTENAKLAGELETAVAALSAQASGEPWIGEQDPAVTP